MKKLLVFIVGFLCISFSSHGVSHTLSKEECAEGSDFIKNAALARENGMDGITFIAKMHDDFQVIKSFPPSVRWFAQDREEEDFLLAAAASVFEKPKEPTIHQNEFLQKCFARRDS
jgi:hypothetical protein